MEESCGHWARGKRLDWYGTIAVVSRARRLLQNYYTTEESYSEEHQYISTFTTTSRGRPSEERTSLVKNTLELNPSLKTNLQALFVIVRFEVTPRNTHTSLRRDSTVGLRIYFICESVARTRG